MTNTMSVNINTATTSGKKLLARVDWRLVILGIAMVAVAIFFGAINSYFLSVQNVLNIARQASLLAVVAIGMNLVIVSGEIDLSVGAIVGVVCVALPAFFDFDVPVPLAILLALLTGAVAGFVNGVITLKLLVPSFLTTLGTMAVYRGIALYISDQPRTIYNDQFISLFAPDVLGIPLIIVYPVVLACVVAFLWKYTRVGVLVRAVGSSEQSARFAGLQTGRVKMLVFMASGACAALGGILLLGRTQMGLAVAADGIELNAIAAVILGGGRLGGGKGSVVGAVLGALLLTVISSGIAGIGLAAAWQMLTKGVILVAVILLMRR
jgi:ribose transport system permease protein